MKKNTSPPSNASATTPHPMPIPAFAPVDKPELAVDGKEVSDAAVLVGVLDDVLNGSDEIKVADEEEEIELLDVAVADDELELELLVGAEVDIVAPDEPRVTASVFNNT
jgi:hypothetical protein